MKIVREHINEKFSEESDPIKDMDIGLSFKNLLPGMILEIMTDIIISVGVITKGTKIIVTEVLNTGRNKRIKYIFSGWHDRALSKKEETWFISPDYFKDNLKIVGISEIHTIEDIKKDNF